MKKQRTILSLCLAVALLCTACGETGTQLVTDNAEPNSEVTATQKDGESGGEEVPPVVVEKTLDFDYIVVKGKKLIFPFKLSELIDLGYSEAPWAGYGTEMYDFVVAPKERLGLIREIHIKDDFKNMLGIVVYNPEDTEAKIGDCLVYGIDIDNDSTMGTDLTLGDDVNITQSLDEMISHLGTPTKDNGILGAWYTNENADTGEPDLQIFIRPHEDGVVDYVSFYSYAALRESGCIE